jgi:hypothetical protein
MSNRILSFFGSFGLKRGVASLISIVLELANSIPELQPVIPVLTWIGAFFGITGVTHGAISSTLSQHTLTSIASALVTLQAIATQVPALQPYIGIIRTLSAVFAAISLGAKAQGVKDEKIVNEAVSQAVQVQGVKDNNLGGSSLSPKV